MITFLLGLPGSGKTAYAVDRIFNNFSDDETAKKDKKVTFQNCYTNINEFKFDLIQNVHQLDFDIIYKILVRLHSHTVGKNKKSDKYLLALCQKLKIKDTLFVIDEAHNHFDKEDKILVWWLAYHRHLHHEITLITQSLGLIALKYKKFSEFFYVAKPQSLLFNKNYFKYMRYTESRMSKASFVGDIKLKINPKIFSLYKSGDSVNVPNIVLKYVLMAASLLVAVILFINMFIFDTFSSKEVLPGTIQKASQENIQNLLPGNAQKTQFVDNFIPEHLKNNTPDINDINNRTLFSVSCSLNSCDNKDISLSPQLVALFMKYKHLSLLHKDTINKNLTVFYFDTSKDFYEYLKPKKEFKEDEKNNNNNIGLGFIADSKR